MPPSRRVRTCGCTGPPARPGAASTPRYDHLAAHGNNLVPFSRTYYRFINRATGEVRFNDPGVSHNSVMRDDNRDYPNNRVFAGRLLSPGFRELSVAFQDRCDYVTYTAFLGYVQL